MKLSPRAARGSCGWSPEGSPNEKRVAHAGARLARRRARRARRGAGHRGRQRHERRFLCRPREPGARARRAPAARRGPGARRRPSVERAHRRAAARRRRAKRRGAEFRQHGAARWPEPARRRQGGERELSAARAPAHRARTGRAGSGRREVRASVERARRFLALTALLAAVLAGVAIALGTRRFVERHLDGCAVLRCLGATQAQLLRLHAGEFALLGFIACAIGALIGYGAQLAIGAALAELIRAELPPPTPWPALQGFLVGLVLLLGFALPPLMHLKNVPALRVIRREAGAPKRGALAAYGLGLALLAALLVWQSGDVTLGAYVVGGFAAAVLVFFVAAWAALGALSRLRIGNRALRYGLANLRRHARGNAVQVASLAVALP